MSPKLQLPKYFELTKKSIQILNISLCTLGTILIIAGLLGMSQSDIGNGFSLIVIGFLVILGSLIFLGIVFSYLFKTEAQIDVRNAVIEYLNNKTEK